MKYDFNYYLKIAGMFLALYADVATADLIHRESLKASIETRTQMILSEIHPDKIRVLEENKAQVDSDKDGILDFQEIFLYLITEKLIDLNLREGIFTSKYSIFFCDYVNTRKRIITELISKTENTILYEEAKQISEASPKDLDLAKEMIKECINRENRPEYAKVLDRIAAEEIYIEAMSLFKSGDISKAIIKSSKLEKFSEDVEKYNKLITAIKNAN